MKISVLFVSFLSFIALGCSASEMIELPYTLPQLLSHESFPPIPGSLSSRGFELTAQLYILETGVVGDARLLRSSGDEHWDSLAVQKILLWKFTPAKMRDTPVKLWIRQRISLRLEEPLMLYLSEIAVRDSTTADSLYAALSAGADFSDLAWRYSCSDSRVSRGIIGEVEIHRYPEPVRRALERLKAGEHTAPLTLGEKRIIFKRDR
jgi:TonB family protein